MLSPDRTWFRLDAVGGTPKEIPQRRRFFPVFVTTWDSGLTFASSSAFGAHLQHGVAT